ncbi:3-oxoacyl-[acyl-carrier-protein] synthase 2 [Synergistales bacterium]|nr:3-oxoacyl-[acyl-carrier-protein] synthase 2 [Synergistales bacterium]
MRRTVITGLGVVSPIGWGKEAYWDALAAGKNGVGPINLFDTEGHTVKIAAEVRDFDIEQWMDKKEARRADRVVHFALPAADMAVKDSGIDVASLDPFKFGVYIGSGEGGITTTHANYDILREKGPSKVSPFFVPMMLSNMPAAYTAMRFGAKGPNMAVVTACSTATHCLGEAACTIARGDADVILAGGAEAAITPIAIAGFANMKALSARNDDPARASRPFDRDRDGFVMGEGAGILLLEELEHARARGAHIYAEVSGYGNTCDAYHITAPDPDGSSSIEAMRIAMRNAGWAPEQVDLYNAHGTSTELNDKGESWVISKVFGEHAEKMAVHSTKSMIGHCLGAAGAVETIAAIMAIERGIIHPSINYDNQDPECARIGIIANEAVTRKVDRVIINNAGFGGHNGVLAIGRIE